MKKNMFMIAALVGALVMPAVSQGAASVWFEYVSGPGTVVQQGEGQALIIEKPADPGTYTYEISMFADITGTAVYGASTTLATDGPAAVVSETLLAPPGGSPVHPGNLGAFGPGDIATNFGGSTFAPPGWIGPAINMGSLIIVIDKTQDHADITSITARIGTGVWGQSDFQAPNVSYAGGPSVGGAVIGAGEAIAIQFVNVPEPATLSLLGLGAIALIRRRR